jgi:hypothetical protein
LSSKNIWGGYFPNWSRKHCASVVSFSGSREAFTLRRRWKSVKVQFCLPKRSCLKPCASILSLKVHTRNSWTFLMAKKMIWCSSPLGALHTIRTLSSRQILFVSTMGYRYRSPLCILFTPQIIATACYVLAQRVIDGPHSPSLDARISFPAPSTSLPTPPSHKPSSPDASRHAIDHFNFNEDELSCVSGESLYNTMRRSIADFTHHQRHLAFFSNFTLLKI